MPMSDKATFTLVEAADVLSCHRETVRRAIKDGVLRAARLGREYRISRPDLEAFWASCGGGDLFDREGGAEAEKASPEDGGPKKRGKKAESLQLHLLGEARNPASQGKSPLDGPIRNRE